MLKRNNQRIMAGATFLFGLFTTALPAATIVGNGDDGTDLEGAVALTYGPIVETREKARQLLHSLNTAGVPALGMLIPEVAGSNLYLAQLDSNARLDGDSGHADLRGLVYARTFARAHSATRFFPVALKLSSDQLVALHIHEGLHRALPPAVNEDEAIVSALTLALTSPGATHDQVLQTVDKVVPRKVLRFADPNSVTKDELESTGWDGSNVGTSFHHFFISSNPSTYPIYQMQTIHSHVYPFGGIKNPVGFGIELSMIRSEQGIRSGPVNLSGRVRLLARRGFEVGLLVDASLNTLSSEELKNSPFGRDVFTLGISAKKNFASGYVENIICLSAPGSSHQTVGSVAYTTGYGTSGSVKIRTGLRAGLFELGGFFQLHLADYLRQSGGAFNFDSGRYRLISAGPEVRFTAGPVQLSAYARFLLESDKGANFDYLGDLMGPGVSQGSIGLTATIKF